MKHRKSKLKWLMSTIVLLFQFSYSFCQIPKTTCDAPDPAAAELSDYLSDVNQIKSFTPKTKNAFVTSATIPVNFTIVRKDDGTNSGTDITMEHIDNIIENCNNNFAHLSWTFEKCGITYIDNTNLYDNWLSSQADIKQFSYSPSAACVYLVDSNAGSASGPQATGVNNVLYFGYFTAWSNTNKVVPHEFGHYFGLLHTFGLHNPYLSPPSNNQSDHPYLGTAPRELVIRELTPGALFEEINCDYAGDMVCDTPADGFAIASNWPNPNVPDCVDNNIFTDCPNTVANQGWSYNSNCEYTGNYQDYNNHVADPLTNNHMSYFNDACRNSFTAGQDLRMEFYHDNFRELQHDNAACGTLNDNVVYHGNDEWPVKNVRMIFSHPNDQRSMRTMTGLTGSFQAHIYESNVMADVWKLGSGADFEYIDSDWNPPTTSSLSSITTLDLLQLQSYILNGTFLDTGYKKLAADVNNSGTITTFDLIRIRQVVLGINSSFPELDAPWRFIPEYIPTNHQVDFDANPFTVLGASNADYTLPDWEYQINGSFGNDGFHAVLSGDVSAGQNINDFTQSDEAETRNNRLTPNLSLAANEIIDIKVNANASSDILGYQLGLNIDFESFELVEILEGDLEGFKLDNFGLNNLEKNELKGLWIADQLKKTSINETSTLFTIRLKAKKEIFDLNEKVHLDNKILNSEFYDSSLNITSANLFLEVDQSTNQTTSISASKIRTYPNPASRSLNLVFQIEKQSVGEISIFDHLGQKLKSIQKPLIQGENTIEIEDLNEITQGSIVIKIQTNNETLTGKAIIVK